MFLGGAKVTFAERGLGFQSVESGNTGWKPVPRQSTATEIFDVPIRGQNSSTLNLETRGRLTRISPVKQETKAFGFRKHVRIVKTGRQRLVYCVNI